VLDSKPWGPMPALSNLVVEPLATPPDFRAVLSAPSAVPLLDSGAVGESLLVRKSFSALLYSACSSFHIDRCSVRLIANCSPRVTVTNLATAQLSPAIGCVRNWLTPSPASTVACATTVPLREPTMVDSRYISIYSNTSNYNVPSARSFPKKMMRCPCAHSVVGSTASSMAFCHLAAIS
jgi:hypothetical protein